MNVKIIDELINKDNKDVMFCIIEKQLIPYLYKPLNERYSGWCEITKEKRLL